MQKYAQVVTLVHQEYSPIDLQRYLAEHMSDALPASQVISAGESLANQFDRIACRTRVRQYYEQNAWLFHDIYPSTVLDTYLSDCMGDDRSVDDVSLAETQFREILTRVYNEVFPEKERSRKIADERDRREQERRQAAVDRRRQRQEEVDALRVAIQQIDLEVQRLTRQSATSELAREELADLCLQRKQIVDTLAAKERVMTNEESLAEDLA